MEFVFLTILLVIRLITKYFEIPVAFQFVVYSLFLFYYLGRPAVEFVRLLIFNFIISSIIISSFIPLEINYVSAQLATIILFRLIIGKFTFSFKNQGLFVLLFLFLLIVSIFSKTFANNNLLAQSRLQMLIFASLFYVFVNFISFKNDYITSTAVLYGITLCSLFIILLSYINISFSEREVVELNDNYKLNSASLLPDRNYASGLISFGVAIVLIEKEKIKNVWLVGFMVLIFFGSQILLGSRGGLITTVSTICFYGIHSYFNKSKSTTNVFFYILPVIISLFIFDTTLIESRFKEDSLEGQSGRQEIRQESFSNYSNQDVSKIVYGGGSFYGFLVLGNNKSIHNNFLEVLYDYGIIGLMIFIFSLLYSWKKHPYNKIIIFVYCLVSFSLSPIISIVYWVFLVISFSTYGDSLIKPRRVLQLNSKTA